MPLSVWLGLVGATLIVTWSHLFRPLRLLAPAFLACPLCVGTWVGWVGALTGRLTAYPFLPWFEIACTGPAVGLVSLFVVSAANRWDRKP